MPANIPKKFGGRAKTKKVDDGHPKRPLNAYLFFANNKRSVVKTQQPNLKPTDVIKELGPMMIKFDTKIK